jgi:hemerythrin-like domain-containing protein
MADKSMNLVIHSAFRRDFDRFEQALSKPSAEDDARAVRLKTAWANFHAQLVDHHQGEHRIAWPALKAVGVKDEVIAKMDTEHEQMAQKLAVANAAFDKLGTPGASVEAAGALAELRDVTLTHFDHEESELEPVYLEKADTPEIKAMARKFARVPPKQAGVFFAWVRDGASAADVAALRDTVPGPVLKIIPALFGRSYTRDIAPVWRDR